MDSLVFFGKGGIGKSTIASNVSVLLAAKGAKVLHVGCDPKGDSTLSLAGRRIPHFAEGGVFSGEQALRASIHPSLFPGISCVEAGGPQAGVGCAGAGIGAMLDIMKEFSVLEKDGYGAAVFDVLGDVVCGGFAAPLRRGLAGKAVIVVSEELLSIYAANKLVGMINNYSRNGVWLAGVAVNAKDPRGVRLAEAFAAAARTKVLGVIPRDPAVARAERVRKPVASCEPDSPASAALAKLVAAIRAARRPARQPEMLGDEELQQLFSSGRAAKRRAGPAAAEALPPAEALRRAGFSLKGLSGDQVVCSWTGLRGAGDVYIAPLDSAREGMARFSDWAVCFGPGGDGSAAREELEASAAAVSFLKFEEIIRAFGGRADAAGQNSDGGAGWTRFVRAGAEAGGRVADAELELGQWSSFILPGADEAFVPPGTVLLEHGDEECRFSSCEQTPLSAYQKARGGLTGGVAGPSGPALPKETELLFSTGFTYAEAVRGDAVKVERSLAAAAKVAGRGGLVEFYNTCSPMLLATDLAPCVEKAAAAGAVEIVRENFNTFNSAGPEKARARASYMARRLRALGKPARRYDVNLAWQGPSRSALEELLSGAGLTFAPAGGNPYSAMAVSKLQVLPAPDPVFSQAFDAAGLKWACPRAPYGLAASKFWLEAIFKALGRKPGRRSAPPAELSRDYARLAAGAAGCSAVFVCEGEQLARLDGGALVCGVPVLSFLAEAGFSLAFLVPEKDAPAARAALRALPAAQRGAKLSFFRDPPGLRRLLASGPRSSLVYSDIPLDPRAAEAGRTSFSSAQFSPGFAGAVATLDLLLRLCRWDFNAKYLAGKNL
ncbi:MAG: AAA family ATPase [Elusimicrobiales bacterium]|nr:AAA family ATPase [Elusimicrobiales bacterium]